MDMASLLGRVLAASVLGVVLCTACGASTNAPMPTGSAANDPQLLRGRSVYTANCARCHGIAGGGGMAPDFRDGRLQRDFATQDALVEFVKRGRGQMPAWNGRLFQADIEAVVRYVREVLANATK